MPWTGTVMLVAPLAGSLATTVFPAVQNEVSAVQADGMGKAAGTNAMISEVVGVFGVAVLTAVLTARDGSLFGARLAEGLAPATGVTSVLAFAGALLVLTAPKGSRACPTRSKGARRRRKTAGQGREGT